MPTAKFHLLPSVMFTVALVLPVATVNAGDAPASEPIIVTQAGGAEKADAKASGKAVLSASDRKFVEEAAMGSLLEVQLGQLADNNAESEEVRKFGQRMVQDHGKASSDLLQVVEPTGMTLPKSLDEQHKKQVDKLKKLKGKEFDQAYMKEMVQAHEKDVAKFRKQADGSGHAELKQFASTTLPTLQEHLTMARDISKTVQGGSGKSGGAAGKSSATDSSATTSAGVSGR